MQNKMNKDFVLNSVSNRPGTKKESWQAIQEAVETNFNATKEVYKGLYKVAEEGAAKIKAVPENTFKVSKKIFKDVKGSLVSAYEEKGLKGALDTMVTKLKPDLEGQANKIVEGLQKEGLVTEFEDVLELLKSTTDPNLPKEIAADVLIKTRRSISRMQQKSDLVPGLMDLLKPIYRALTEDIHIALGNAETPVYLDAFKKADNVFKESVKTFRNESVLNIRKSQVPENLSKYTQSPSRFEKLTGALSGDKNAIALSERLVLEEAVASGEKALNEFINEGKGVFGESSIDAAKKIRSSGDKLTNTGSQNIARARINESIQNWITTGNKPTDVIDLMKTPTGRNLVEKSLKTSPSGRKLMNKLDKIIFEDFIGSISKGGKIDFEKASEILSDKKVRDYLIRSAGKESANFFTNLETKGNNLSENLRILSNKDPSYVDKIKEAMLTKSGLSLLAVLSIPTGGKALALPLIVEGAQRIKANKLAKILSDKEVIDTLKIVSSKDVSPEKMKKSLNAFFQIVNKINTEDEEEE